MKKRVKKVKITYEPESDVLSWEVGKEPIDFARESGNMIVHFSKKNIPVYVEVLEASKFLSKAKKLISGHVRKETVLA